MNLQQIVAELQAERDRLDKAIAALNGVSNRPRRGRPPKSLQSFTKPKRRRRMSAAARQRISQASKRRWAEWRKKRAKAA